MDPPGQDFEEFYAHGPVVRALLVASGDREVAGDVVAEAFSRAFERWDRVQHMENPTGWVYRVSVNLLRRRWTRARLERSLLRRRRPTGSVAEIDLVPELWAAIAALPLRQRTAIALRYVADLSERDVAAAMGIAEGTASAALVAARRRLASDLQHLEELRWT
jgi:RNA polymerase sigma-70 factor (ECF subfamily)